MPGKKVLIVDDDQSLARAIALRCQAIGLEAVTSSDGMHALLTITQNPPDLAIIDLNMNVVGGLTICEKLARDPMLQPIAVIVMTGNSDEKTVRRCLELGAHYVPKGRDTWETLRPVACALPDLPNPGP